jgi:enoyl-CoA hydratase
LVGKSVAKQVILAGLVLTAEDALRHGLVCEVVVPGSALRAAYTLAERVSRSAPLALRLSKAVLDEEAPHPLLDDIAQAVLFESPDKRDRMGRFLEKSRL